jgi:hypothetical protein
VRTYKDLNGQEHRLLITLATRQRLIDQHGVDLVECAVKPEALEAFLTQLVEPDKLFQVLATVEACNVEALLSAADLQVQESAGAALIEALADFFPQSSPLKAALVALVQKVKGVQTTAAEEAETAMLNLINTMDISKVLSESSQPTNGSAESVQSPDAQTLEVS